MDRFSLVLNAVKTEARYKTRGCKNKQTTEHTKFRLLPNGLTTEALVHKKVIGLAKLKLGR